MLRERVAVSRRGVPDDAPLLRLLVDGGGSSGVFAALGSMRDAVALRATTPLAAAAVAAHAWRDDGTRVKDGGVVGWRRSFPGARALWWHRSGPCRSDAAAWALLGSLEVLRLHHSDGIALPVALHHTTSLTTLVAAHNDAITTAVVATLPCGLRVLDVRGCVAIRSDVRFRHLPALQQLHCSGTAVGDAAIASLQPSVTALDVRRCRCLTAAVSFGHLPHLAELHCGATAVSDATVATLSPALQRVNLLGCSRVTAAVTLQHLPALRSLRCAYTAVGADAVASAPPTLEELYLTACTGFHPRLLCFDHLPALRTLRCGATTIDDALVAALPRSLCELHVPRCARLTHAVSFSHLSALTRLYCWRSDIGAAAIASLPPSLVELDVSHVGDCHAVSFRHLPHLAALGWESVAAASTLLNAAALRDLQARGCRVQYAALCTLQE